MRSRPDPVSGKGKRLSPKSENIAEEREAQLKESLEIVNRLLDSSHRTHLVDSIRAVLRKRHTNSSLKF